ncbi:MAG: hypothetical protein RI985_1543, partial [Chloroflexota bacterium]
GYKSVCDRDEHPYQNHTIDLFCEGDYML